MKYLVFIILILLTSCSTKNKYNGIDISHHNKVNWKCIKNSNITFCYIKTTEGKSFKDPKVEENYKNAKLINLKVGFYHYYIYNVPAIEQFNNFNYFYKEYNTDLIPVIDVEDDGNSYENIENFNNNLKSLINLFYKNYKIYPIIYLGSKNSFKTFPVIYKCKLWIGIIDNSRYIPASIYQISVTNIGNNKIDVNYCKNIKSILK